MSNKEDNLKLTLQEAKILVTMEIEEMYGYQIVKEMGGKIKLGSLYGALNSLQKKGFLKSSWGEESGPGGRRRYYRITAKGSDALERYKYEVAMTFGFKMG